ncbi:hypothetical protein [Thermomonospora umbrina]|uniref:Uncharacterized protein n=1 Tax=Thermomonospora umbrina TaxID=111806 RepID=A0A3D9SXJ3_9ACTN|nr:hypothetical protein [Thermomonospora umbrina]REF00677.1 hypothetical protein DFJ69_6234 [Thermomonospora umbrina]
MHESSDSRASAGVIEPAPNRQDRSQALHNLGGLLCGQGYTVEVESLHLTVVDGGRPVEVWAQRRPEDGNRLWFTWAGGIRMCPADQPQDAVVAIKGALKRVLARM